MARRAMNSSGAVRQLKQDRRPLALGAREIHVHYRNGIGDSKLKIPAARAGTARNINTVAKLVGMVAE